MFEWPSWNRFLGKRENALKTFCVKSALFGAFWKMPFSFNLIFLDNLCYNFWIFWTFPFECSTAASLILKLLEERNGNWQLLIYKYITKLLSLEFVPSIYNLKTQVYVQVQTQVHGLENLALDPKSYGSLLVPVFDDKITGQTKTYNFRPVW